MVDGGGKTAITDESAGVPVLLVRLAGRQLAIPLARIVRVLQAVAPEPLPGAPPGFDGLVDVHGTLIPLLDVRALFGLAPRKLSPDEHLVVVDTSAGQIALRCDEALGLRWISSLRPAVRGQEELGDMPAPAGVAVVPSGILFLYDPDAFLNEERSTRLAAAMARTVEAQA